MKSLKIALAVLGGLLSGLGWIWLGDGPVTTSRLATAGIFMAIGFASLFWRRASINWRIFLCCQLPLIGISAWCIASLYPDQKRLGILLGYAAFLLIFAVIKLIDFRLTSGLSRDSSIKTAEQDGDAEEAV